MNKTFCQNTAMRYDERLQRMLNGYEFRHFMNLLAFAAEGRDPTFIPARRLENMRLALGLTKDKCEQRLVKFESERLDLIQRTPDGLLITYLVDQEEGEEDGTDITPASARRLQSMTPGAIRIRNLRARQQEGAISQEGIGGEDVTLLVTPSPSKRNALALQTGVTNGARPSRMRDGNVQRTNPILNLNSSQEEENTLNVTAPPTKLPNVTPPTAPAAPQPVRAASRFPVPKNGRARQLADAAIKIAQELQDIGSEDGHFLLLAVADENNADDVIQNALRSTRRRMNNAKMPPLDRPGAYYQKAVRKQFEERQIFLPTKADMAAEDDPSEIRRLIAESMAAAPSGTMSMPPSVVPLDDLYDGADSPPLDSGDEGYVP